jgi:hypothetical protein
MRSTALRPRSRASRSRPGVARSRDATPPGGEPGAEGDKPGAQGGQTRRSRETNQAFKAEKPGPLKENKPGAQRGICSGVAVPGHCEEHSDEAIQQPRAWAQSGSLRCARNDPMRGARIGSAGLLRCARSDGHGVQIQARARRLQGGVDLYGASRSGQGDGVRPAPPRSVPGSAGSNVLPARRRAAATPAAPPRSAPAAGSRKLQTPPTGGLMRAARPASGRRTGA